MARFAKGEGGRPKGARNKLTITVRETVLNVFNQLQDDSEHNLKAFAQKNPKEFYQIAAKLIPTELTGTTTQVFRVLTEEEAKTEDLTNE